MTSKSPSRSCEDTDEVSLKYAEVKALASGNPLILEKTQLDTDVTKLKLMKANHVSQHYALEDRLLKSFPKQIQTTQEWKRSRHMQRMQNTPQRELQEQTKKRLA